MNPFVQTHVSTFSTDVQLTVASSFLLLFLIIDIGPSRGIIGKGVGHFPIGGPPAEAVKRRCSSVPRLLVIRAPSADVNDGRWPDGILAHGPQPPLSDHLGYQA